MDERTIEKQIIEQIESQLDNVIEDALKLENLKSFLRVVGHFPQFAWKNLLLIWKQSPCSLCLAGKEAFQAAGRELDEEAKPIMLLYPMFSLLQPGEPDMALGRICVSKKTGVAFKTDPIYEYRYRPVKVYELSATTGKETYTKKDFHFSVKNIKLVTGYDVRQAADNEKIPSYEKGKIIVKETDKGEKGSFVLIKGLSEEETDRTLARLYVENEIDKYMEEETELGGGNILDEFEDDVIMAFKKFVVCAVLNFYYMKADDVYVPSLQKSVDALSIEQKRLFVKLLCQKASEYIMDLSDKQLLTFNETAIANSLLHTTDYAEAYISFINVALRVNDADMREEIQTLADKLEASKNGYLQKLIDKINGHELYTYPPCEFEYITT